MRSRAFLLALALTVPVHAQTPAALARGSTHHTVPPDLSLDIAAGGGAHTLHTPSGYYRPDRAAIFRASAIVALGPRRAIRPVVVVDATSGCLGFLCAQDDVCAIAPDNTCENNFRAPGGVAVGVGASGAWSRYLVGTVEGGVGSPSRHTAFVGANLAVRLSSHFALTGDVRQYRFTNEHGERVWVAPFSAGVRVY